MILSVFYRFDLTLKKTCLNVAGERVMIETVRLVRVEETNTAGTVDKQVHRVLWNGEYGTSLTKQTSP